MQFLESDKVKKDKLKRKLFKQILPYNIKFLEAKLSRNNRSLFNKASNYLVGDKLSFADIFIVLVLDWLGKEKREQVLEEYPNVKKHFIFIKSNLKIVRCLRGTKLPKIALMPQTTAAV